MKRVTIALASFAATACGLTKRIPEIARDLPSNFAEGEIIFNARVQTRFPIGTEQSEVEHVLKTQGFEVRQTGQAGLATFNNRAFPVASVWNVGWTSANGRITEIYGIYGGRGP